MAPEKKKQSKRSASFSKDATKDKSITDKSNVSAKYDKKTKRGKFEKPTEKNKSDKATKPNFSPKSDKTKAPLSKDKKNGNKTATQGAQGEKPDWIEFKKEKKELKEKRKAKRLTTVYEASVKAKMLGEKLRRTDCTAEKRTTLTKKLYESLEGNICKAIFTHDMSRVIQWLIKYGSPEIRGSVLNEMKPSLVLMFQSKYVKNCVKKMLRHGTDDIRKEIISACYGNVVKLVSHSVSSSLVDYAYTFATDLNKIHFKQEFYGDMYKQAKDDKVKSISDVYASANDMKSATLSAVKINLVRVLNKNIVGSPIAQAVLLDYLGICTNEDRAEMIVMLRSSIVELSRTDCGAKIAMLCVWHGTTKDRKLSLKALKQHVKELAISEHGHIVLMAIFDSVDDTVLMKKLVIPEIVSDLVEIATNEYGRRVVLYLVARRDSHYFHPALVEQLKQGDDNATSKKSADVRENELVEAIVESFLESIATNVTSWLANSSTAIVTLAILKRGHGERLASALEAIAQFIADPESKLKEDKGGEISAVEHPGLHMILKKLILTDKIFAEKNCPTFGEALEKSLDENAIKHWISFNRACFLLVLLLENAVESVVNSLKPKIKTFSQSLTKKTFSGALILLKKLK